MKKFPTGNSGCRLSTYFMCICMAYYMCVITSIVVFQKVVTVNFGAFEWDIPGSLFPYVFLYPIGYVVLKVYGYPVISKMIMSTLLMSLIFVLVCTLIINLPSNTLQIDGNLKAILDASIRFYMAGLIAMPAGAFASLHMVNLLKNKIHQDYILFIISTLVGELINTIIVFTIAFVGVYSIGHIITEFVVSAYIFKIIAAIVTTPLAVFGVRFLVKKSKAGEI